MEFLFLPGGGLILSIIVFAFSAGHSRRFLFYTFWLLGAISQMMSILFFLTTAPEERMASLFTYHNIFMLLGFASMVFAMIAAQLQERTYLYSRIIEERQQRAASEITQLAASNTNLPELLNFSLDKIISMLDLAGGAIHVFHRARGKLVLGSYMGLTARLARRLETIDFGDTAIGRTARNKRLLIVRNLRLSQDYEFFGGRQDGFSYMALVPIVSDGENWGVITLFGSGAYKPGSLQVDLLESFGEQLGAALVLGRQVRNLQSARENLDRLVKSLGQEVLASGQSGRNGLHIVRGFAWSVTRLFGGDRYDICLQTGNSWKTVLSSESTAPGQTLSPTADLALRIAGRTGTLSSDMPPPFDEFPAARTYFYCSLPSETTAWFFIRAEGHRRPAAELDILEDSFKIIFGLYRQFAREQAKTTVSKERITDQPILERQYGTVLNRISDELAKLISEYSGAQQNSDIKDLLIWLESIRKTAANSQLKIPTRQITPPEPEKSPARLSDIIEAAVERIESAKNNGFEIVYKPENTLPGSMIPSEILRNSVAQFLSTALFGGNPQGSLRLTARGENRTLLLQLDGTELSPAPRTNEKPLWLTQINGRLECARLESDQGNKTDSWRLIIPLGDDGETRTSPRPRPLRILAVDNQDVIRELLTGMLASLGYDSVVVEQSKDAISLFKDAIKDGKPFGVVIADYGLDNITGLELAREIKSLAPDIFFLLVSGWGLEPDKEKAQQMGIDMMLKKPFRMEQLSEILTSAAQKLSTR